MQLTKTQERVRGIIERAHALLEGAQDQMYDVFFGDSTAVRNIEAANATCNDVLAHFREDAIAYNEDLARAKADVAAREAEDEAVDTLLRDSKASFDDKGKRIGKDGPPRRPPAPKPRPKGDDENDDTGLDEHGPETRNRLSDFGDGSDQ